MNTLTAIKRSKTDNLAIIRNNGMVPGVVYGAQVENTTISVLSVDFEKILKVAGETSTIVLELQDEKLKSLKKFNVLIHEVQVHPVKGFPIHVDFLAIDMNKPIEVSVPIEFIGKAQAEKDSLGVLVKALHEVEIEALPKDIPQHIDVDVTIIDSLEKQILVKDIILPKGVIMITNQDEVVALVTVVKEEVETEAVDLSSIEVEKKGKQEVEGEEPKKAE